MPAVDERYEVELFCNRCDRTTGHLVTPGNARLSRVLCIVCGRAVVVDTLQFMEQYVDGVVRRVLAKPFEIATQFTRHPRRFITTLPGRALTKPFRVAAELRATMDIVRPRRRPVRRPSPTVPAKAGELPPAQRRFRVLLSAPVLWAHEPREIIETAVDLGYDGVEVWAYQVLRDGVDPASLGDRARRRDLVVTLHALSWDLNPSSSLEPIRAASLGALHDSVEMAVKLGAEMVVMHPGRTTDPHDSADAYWPRLIDAVREVADHAAKHDVRIGVEHMESRQGEFVITAADINRLVREVGRSNVGAVVDVAHIPWGEDEPTFIAEVERIVHVHLSDADEARLHLPLGQGARNLPRVLGALRAFDGTITLEGTSISAGRDLARWNKAWFEDFWRESATRQEAIE